MKTSEDSFAIGGSGWTDWTDNTEYNYSEGLCITKEGLISLYTQGDSSSAYIIHKGRHCTLWIHSPITKLGLVRVAKKWAEELERNKC